MQVPHKCEPRKLTPTKVKALENYAREVNGDWFRELGFRI
jgi:hypothetical protein